MQCYFCCKHFNQIILLSYYNSHYNQPSKYKSSQLILKLKMSIKKVMDFFQNKVTIELKTGHRFQGLLSKVDYKNNTIILQDIQHLNNVYDKQEIPHDKKIAEKAFQADSIQEVLFTNHHFSQPKKYNPDDFFDSMTEETSKKFEKGQHRNNRGRGNRPDNFKGGYKKQYKQYKQHRGKNYRDKKNYEEKGKYSKKQEQDDDRDYR